MMLCEAAWAAIRTKGSYLAAKFYKLRARRGGLKALIAIAHKILLAAYWIIKNGSVYEELGGEFLDKLHANRRRDGLVRALEALGLKVTLTPREPAAP